MTKVTADQADAMCDHAIEKRKEREMEAPSHTAAPWEMDKKTVVSDHGFKVYGYPISAGGQAIARVHAGSVGKEAFSFGNQEANAHLIVTAPDLLEALQEALEEIHHPGSYDYRKNADISDMIHAVIAKARGEQS